MASISNEPVSSSTTTTKVSPTIQFDPSYAKTVPGMLKVAQIVISLIGFICVQSDPAVEYRSAGGWYSFVSMTAFWVTLVLLIFYLFHLIEKLHNLPWLLAEMAYCGIWCAFYFIAGAVSASKATADPAYGAAAFFGFVAMFLYGYDGFLKFTGWRNGDIAQGERTTTSNSATTAAPSSPSYPAY